MRWRANEVRAEKWLPGGDLQVESFGSVGQLGGANVHDPMLFFEVRVLGADFIEDLVKQAVGELHNVVFRETGHFFTFVAPCVLEGVANNLFGSRPADQLQALVDLVGLPVLDACV